MASGATDRIVLGIDPGSRHTGIAILRQEGSRFEVLMVDVLHTIKQTDHAERISEIYSHLVTVIQAWKPTSCAIETPVYGKDPLALLKLGRAQAAAILAAINSGLDVTEYYPKAVKKSITGNGNASKEQVAAMLNTVLKLDNMKYPKDATDALSVAWCHLTRRSIVGADVGADRIRPPSKSRRALKDPWADYVKQNPERVKS
jgi:crossover junction endodeoxyribonuclease RuvC